jgi:hypothetical protein
LGKCSAYTVRKTRESRPVSVANLTVTPRRLARGVAYLDDERRGEECTDGVAVHFTGNDPDARCSLRGDRRSTVAAATREYEGEKTGEKCRLESLSHR